jgi:hypothetical protein
MRGAYKNKKPRRYPRKLLNKCGRELLATPVAEPVDFSAMKAQFAQTKPSHTYQESRA